MLLAGQGGVCNMVPAKPDSLSKLTSSYWDCCEPLRFLVVPSDVEVGKSVLGSKSQLLGCSALGRSMKRLLEG
jgi:hypothetical protein